MSLGFGISRCLGLCNGSGRVLVYGTGCELRRWFGVRSLGLCVASGRVFVYGNRMLLTPFFLGLRRASRYG